MNVAPSNLLSAWAIDTTGDPQWEISSRGAVRIIPNPRLGFPLGPFGIFRGPLYQELTPVDVRWGSGPYATLPLALDGELWGTIIPPADNPEPPLVVIRGQGSTPIEVAAMTPRPLTRASRVGWLQEEVQLGAPNLRSLRLAGWDATIDQVLVAAPNLESIADRAGRIGLPLGRFEAINRLAYLGEDDGGALANERVCTDAPTNSPPHITSTSFWTGQSPTAADEVARVRALVQPSLWSMLKDYVHQMADEGPTWQTADGIATYKGGTHGTLDVGNAVWLAAADPGIARWLGLLGTFKPLPDREPTMVTVGGVWVLPPDRPETAAALQASDPDVTAWILGDNGLDEVVQLARQYEAQGLPVAWLWTQAVAPPVRDSDFHERPATPVVATPTGAWGRLYGSDAYQIRHQVTNATPFGTIGVTRSLAGDPPVPIQPPVEGVSNAVRPLMVKPETSFLDIIPDAEPGHVTWTVWQADAFGRWSEYAPTVGHTIARPDLPRPQPMVRMVPDLGPHLGAEPYTARFDVTIPVPERVPGQLNIDSVELELPWLEGGTFPLPAAPQLVWTNLDGVPTLPATAATGHLQATFIDVDGQRGPTATVKVTFNDPRPPVPIPPPPLLHFTSRDTASGQATARVPLPTGPGIDRYRVFFTTETRLRTVLRPLGIPTPAGGPTRDDRAREWLAIMRDVPREAFDALTVGTTVPTGEYLDLVSGTLAEVIFYRIVPVSPIGAETRFADCPVVPFAVPYPDRPVSPATWTTREGNQVTLNLQARPGAAQAIRWRVRAVQGNGTDPRRGEVIGTGDLAADGTASLPIPALRPFAPIALVAEVLGAPERGLPEQPGLWSQPSPWVSVESIPETAPPIVDWAMASVVGADLVVQVGLDHALLTDPPARYHLQLSQAEGPDRAPTLVAEALIGEPLQIPFVPGGRQFVTAVDPLGRPAPRVPVGLLPPDPVDP